MRAIVVDASAAVRVRLVERLREAGIDVVGEAGRAEEALALARSLQPDAIVLDMQLPGRSGLEILPALRADTRAVIVVVTNAPHPRYRDQCLALGADFFFDKSSEFDSIAAALKK
jgi:DNA-binding NarL/FixJ family response regulator